jgi:multidrug resistance efflux pump
VGLLAPLPAEAQNAPPAGVMLLGAAVSGVIDKIDVADGSHVDAGQILVQINCDPLAEDIKARTAELAALQAAYERARNGSRPDEIAIGEAAVGVARARAEEAQDAYDRLARLTMGITVTQEQIFRAQREARIASAQLDDSQKRLALLQAGTRPEDIAEAQAKRDEAQAQLDGAKARLDQCSIRAPAAGTVKIVATLGEFISTSVPTTLVRLTADTNSR